MTAMINIPETAAPDEVVEIKILIQHPMETGFRTGPDGALVPRNIIRELRCDYGGATVFRAELHPAIAANPFLTFPLRVGAGGEVALIWVDEEGTEHRETRVIGIA